MKTLTLVALVVSLVSAQAPTTGIIAGTVRDAAGLALPDVSVRAVIPGGALAAVAVTDANGAYRLTVPAGTYTVETQLAGFSSQLRTNVTVASASQIAVPFTLRVQVTPIPPGQVPVRPNVNITADRQSRQGTLIQYRGNVRMRTPDTEVIADEIDFDTNTRTADARGNVRIRVVPPDYRVTPLS